MYFAEEKRIEMEVVPGIVIDHLECVKEMLAQKMNLDSEILDLNPMLDYISDEKDTILYFNNKLEIQDAKSEDMGLRFAWADTGHCDKEGKRL